MLDVRQRLIYYSIISNGSIRTLYQYAYRDIVLRQMLEEHEIKITLQCKPEKNRREFQICDELLFEKTNTWTRNGVFPVTIFDSNYPNLLKRIVNPPLVLYIKGNMNVFSKTLVAIVGTRAPSQRSGEVLKRLIDPILERDFATVSGLARGIDTMVHEACIHKPASTIGVLAGGFNHIYPKENKQLALQMGTHQLLISEYPPNIPVEKWRFIERNRIISGLSFTTVVVEAKRKSGSLITAAFAIEQNREVYGIPGCILDPQSEGVHQLIQQGASLLYNPSELVEQLSVMR